MNETRVGRVGQTGIYFGKCCRTFVNEKGWKSLISTVIISVILAWVIGDNTFSVNEPTKTGVFAMICGCIWIGMFNSVQLICRERDIIKREHRTGLHITSYMSAHLLFQLLLCMAEGMIITIVFFDFPRFPVERHNAGVDRNGILHLVHTCYIQLRHDRPYDLVDRKDGERGNDRHAVRTHY